MSTPISFDTAPPIASAEEARERVFDLVGRAIRRQLWLMLLESDGRQIPLLIPIEGIPLRPEPGELIKVAAGMSSVLDQHAPGGSIILTLERPGSADLTACDQAWARELSAAFGKVMSITGLFVAHDEGVCPLRSDLEA